MKFKLKKRCLEFIILLYIYCPIILFLFTWVQIWIAALCTLVMLFVGYRFFRRKSEMEVSVDINYILLLFIILFFLFIGFCVGWGRWTDQVWDWEKHNAVLADLVNKDWPVYYNNKGEISYLSYYIGQYLFPAALGKLTGSFRIAEIAMYIWCVFGVILVWLNAIRILGFQGKIMQVLTAFFIPFFSLPRELAKFVLDIFTRFSSSDVVFYVDDTMRLEYTDNILLFLYVIPQVIVVWMILLLFLDNCEKTNFYLFIMIPGLLYGTFGMMGIIVMAITQCIYNVYRKHNIRKSLHDIFSIDNLFVFSALVPVIVTYLLGNINVAKPTDVGFRFINYAGDKIIIYIIFVVFNIITLVLPLFKENKCNILFYISVGSLLFLPLCSMGKFNDLMMRASIPSIFFLLMCILKFLSDHVSTDIIIYDIGHIRNVDKNKQYTMKELRHFLSIIYICILLSFGVSYGCKTVIERLANNKINELGTIPSLNGKMPIKSLEQWANRNDEDVAIDQRYNYFAYDYKDDFFYKYIARK